MIHLFRMAYRDLGRNRRRSFFSALGLAVALALLMLMASVIEGEFQNSIQSSILLQSGHLQVRAKSYEEAKTSLKWEDLVENPQQVAGQIANLPPVKAATPRLFASGILVVGNESAGVRVFGIDPLSDANEPYRTGLLEGDFLTPDDRQGILVGYPLAYKMGLKVGDPVSLSMNTSNGDVDEQVFTIRGIYSTMTAAFDSNTIFMPLAKAQTITQTENHASTIFILLHEREQTDAVKSALQGVNYEVLDWVKMNEFTLQYEDFAQSYLIILYLIVLGIAATVIMNTLIMAVFERTREIGILAAIGMRGRRIMSMFLAESTMLALGGNFMGLVLGWLVVAYFNRNGFYIGDFGITGFLMPDTIYARLTLQDSVNLALLSTIVTLLAGIYPAWLAANMEPVQALRSEK